MPDKYGRRDFFIKTAQASAIIAAGSSLSVVNASSKPTLVKVKGEGITKNIQAAVKKCLEPLGGMKAFVKKGQKVLLKPNIGFPTPPEQRATTSPQIVAAVAKEVLACGASKVLILDNPTRRPEACMRTVGIKEAISGLKNVNIFLPTSEQFYVSTAIPKGKVLKKTHILKDALKVDVHIALPIAKSHNAAGFSGTLKGMMGLILDRESFHSKFDLNQAVVDLCTVIKADLVIMDGLKVMASDGPAGPGELITCDTIIAGTDSVAVDSAGVTLCPLYGRKIKPRHIKHLKLAKEAGLGDYSPPENEIVTIKI